MEEIISFFFFGSEGDVASLVQSEVLGPIPLLILSPLLLLPYSFETTRELPEPGSHLVLMDNTHESQRHLQFYYEKTKS